MIKEEIKKSFVGFFELSTLRGQILFLSMMLLCSVLNKFILPLLGIQPVADEFDDVINLMTGTVICWVAFLIGAKYRVSKIVENSMSHFLQKLPVAFGVVAGPVVLLLCFSDAASAEFVPNKHTAFFYFWSPVILALFQGIFITQFSRFVKPVNALIASIVVLGLMGWYAYGVPSTGLLPGLIIGILYLWGKNVLITVIAGLIYKMTQLYMVFNGGIEIENPASKYLLAIMMGVLTFGVLAYMVCGIMEREK